MRLSGVTYEQFLTTIVVALILIGAYNTVMTMVKNHREEENRRNRPTNDLNERVNNHDTLLANDKRRIERMETELQDVRDGQKVMVTGIQALVEHALHNGNADQLKDASDGINGWLTNRL